MSLVLSGETELHVGLGFLVIKLSLKGVNMTSVKLSPKEVKPSMSLAQTRDTSFLFLF